MRLSYVVSFFLAALGAVACGAESDEQSLALESLDDLGTETKQPDCLKRKHRPAPQFNDAYVELKRENFQTVIDGKNTDLYTIRNHRGMFVNITNLGAKIEQIVVPDRNGVLGDVVLGYESIDGVRNGQPSMGAFIGRYANRIGNGSFTLDGSTYTILVNEAAPNPASRPGVDANAHAVGGAEGNSGLTRRTRA